jgi:D-alanyl-lipoteichoic acid acyltransferase DltB (MBOAT superfamily)
MKAKRTGITLKKKNVIRSVLVAELILLVPLFAMIFSVEGWDWHVADFIIVGILLAGVGVGYQLIVNGLKNNSRQAAIGIVLATAMVLIWVELAVGIFGTPFAGS